MTTLIIGNAKLDYIQSSPGSSVNNWKINNLFAYKALKGYVDRSK